MKAYQGLRGPMAYYRDDPREAAAGEWVVYTRVRRVFMVLAGFFGLLCLFLFFECVFRIVGHQECALHRFLPHPEDAHKAYRSVPYGYRDQPRN